MDAPRTVSQTIIEKHGVEPARVPRKRLRSGAEMPAIGLGTFGSDQVSGEAVAEAVLWAARAGYRHFDCAAVYGNERFIGESLRKVLSEGVRREELWITSKLWNDSHAEADVIPACERSLKDLGLAYLDLYLIHWPFPNHHPPGCDVGARYAFARPYNHEQYMKTWRQLEKLVDTGLVRHIGTSNMTIPKLKLLLRDADIQPVANQMELHPHFQQRELFRFVTERDMVAIGFSPIGSPARPERDRTPGDTVDVEDPVLVRIAERRGVHPAAVCIRWAVQRGQVPIPFSTNPRHYVGNLAAAVADPLTDEEMKAIEDVDRNCRLIKGQVFLWKEGQHWEDLWDVHGEIVQGCPSPESQMRTTMHIDRRSRMVGAVLPGDGTVEMRTFDIPTPGHGEVLIRMKASTICGSDIRCIYHEHLGKGPEGYRDGIIAGHEPSGQIVEVGSGCRRFAEGDRVVVYHISGCGVCNDCRRGYMISCTSERWRRAYGWQRHGGMANYLLAEEKDLVRLPDALSYTDGAQIACGFGTVYEGLEKIDVSGDDVVLVTGLGPVGLAAAMLARALGASRIIGIDVNDYRLDLARSLGLCDDVVLSGPDDVAAVRTLTGGHGVEKAVECSGSELARRTAVQATRRWGKIVFIGEGGTCQFEPSPDLIHDQKAIYGSWVTSIWRMEELVERIARWGLHPSALITHLYEFDQISDAYATMAMGRCGKVAIVFDDEDD